MVPFLTGGLRVYKNRLSKPVNSKQHVFMTSASVPASRPLPWVPALILQEPQIRQTCSPFPRDSQIPASLGNTGLYTNILNYQGTIHWHFLTILLWLLKIVMSTDWLGMVLHRYFHLHQKWSHKPKAHWWQTCVECLPIFPPCSHLLMLFLVIPYLVMEPEKGMATAGPHFPYRTPIRTLGFLIWTDSSHNSY